MIWDHKFSTESKFDSGSKKASYPKICSWSLMQLTNKKN